MISGAFKEQGDQEIFLAGDVILNSNFLSFSNMLVYFYSIYNLDLTIVSHALKLADHWELVDKTLRYYSVQLVIKFAPKFVVMCVFKSFIDKRRLILDTAREV